MKTLYENRAFFNFVTLSPFRSEGAKQINHPLLICPLSSRQVKYGSLSTVVGDEKLTSREDLIGLLFFYVQSDEDTFLKVDEVSKTEAQPFDVFNQLVSSFQFCV